MSRLFGIVAAPVEGASIRQAEGRQGPAALALVQFRHRVHVDLVEVRSLLAIDLDTDERCVHEIGRRFVFERFPFHDVTPMAGAISDREQDRAIQLVSPLEGFVPPRVPVHRILAVLKQVGAALAGQSIGTFLGGAFLHFGLRGPAV